MCTPEERREMAQFVARCCGGEFTVTNVESAFSEVKGIVEEDGVLDPSVTEERLMEEFCGAAALRGLPLSQGGIRLLALQVQRSLASVGKFTSCFEIPVTSTFRPQIG